MTPARKAALYKKKLTSKSRLGSTKFIATFVEEEEKVDQLTEKEAADSAIPPSEESDSKYDKEEEKKEEPTKEKEESASVTVSPILPKSAMVAIRSSVVATASPLRQVAFSADLFVDNTESQPTSSKRKRDDDDDDNEDQENIFSFAAPTLEQVGKRVKMMNGSSASGLKSSDFEAPRLVHQSWLDKSLTSFSKKVFGF